MFESKVSTLKLSVVKTFVHKVGKFYERHNKGIEICLRKQIKVQIFDYLTTVIYKSTAL